MAIAPAAKRPFADPKQLCRLHLAQLRPLRSTENIGKAHPSYPLVNACPIHPNPPSQEVQMTGHFTSYKTRPNHELATEQAAGLAIRSLRLHHTVIAAGRMHISGCTPTCSGILKTASKVMSRNSRLE